MALSIDLDSRAVSAGATVRGTVHGLETWPDARGLTVNLVHDGKHLDRQVPVAAEIGPPAGGGSPTFQLTVPVGAAPTFVGRHYVSTWRIEARVDLPRRRDASISETIVVLPAEDARPAEGRPVTALDPGVARFRLFAGLFLVADLGALAALYVVSGPPPAPVVLALVLPAAVTLAALAWLGLRPGPVERVAVSAPRARWRFGEEVPVEVAVEGRPGGFDEVEVALAGEEVWVESTGKSSHTRRVAFHQEVHRLRGDDLAAGRVGSRRWSWRLRFRLPASGPASRPRAIEWSVGARAAVARRPDPTARLRLEVAGRATPGDHS